MPFVFLKGFFPRVGVWFSLLCVVFELFWAVGPLPPPQRPSVEAFWSLGVLYRKLAGEAGTPSHLRSVLMQASLRMAKNAVALDPSSGKAWGKEGKGKGKGKRKSGDTESVCLFGAQQATPSRFCLSLQSPLRALTNS
jgi:hypothetical protein